MKDEQHLEKLYDLVEMFDFNDLSDEDRDFVTQNFSYEEYGNLRSTIKDTRKLLAKYPDQDVQNKKYDFKKIAFYPVELYKIVATIFIIAGTMYLFTQLNNSKPQNLIAAIDTVFVKKTDTVVVYVGDTIVRFKELTTTKISSENKMKRTYADSSGKTDIYVTDCSKELCPEDLQKLNALKTRNDFSEDKNLTDFMVSIN